MDKINLIFLFFLLFQINKCKLRDLLEEEEIKIIKNNYIKNKLILANIFKFLNGKKEN